jgi:hypothetical protein
VTSSENKSSLRRGNLPIIENEILTELKTKNHGHKNIQRPPSNKHPNPSLLKAMEPGLKE